MLTAVAKRLKALSPLQLTLVVIAAFALVGGSTATATSLITGADIQDRSVEGRDIARSTVTHANIRNDTVLSQDIRDGHVLSADIRDGTVESRDLSPDVRSRLSGTAQRTAGNDGTTGTKGAGGAAGAPGAFLVKDSNGTTGGTLLGSSGRAMTFDFGGHTFTADAETGALALQQAFSYESADCSGTPLALDYSYPRQMAVGSRNPGDTGLYTYGDRASSTNIGSSWGMYQSCDVYGFQHATVAMVALPDRDVPPALTGPLSYVPAG
jgi:hypothetical protein